MTYPVPVLPDLLVGWQKVADRYNMPIYVFQTADTYHAVSNEAQGVGHLVETLVPEGARRLAEGCRHLQYARPRLPDWGSACVSVAHTASPSHIICRARAEVRLRYRA